MSASKFELQVLAEVSTWDYDLLWCDAV